MLFRGLGSPVPGKQKTFAPIPQNHITLTVTYKKMAEFVSETATKRGQQDRVLLGEAVMFDQMVTVEGENLHACEVISSLSCYKSYMELQPSYTTC